jgi:hypothetical protein
LRRLGRQRHRLGHVRWLDHLGRPDLELRALNALVRCCCHSRHLPLLVGERLIELAHPVATGFDLAFGATVHSLAERTGSLGALGGEL